MWHWWILEWTFIIVVPIVMVLSAIYLLSEEEWPVPAIGCFFIAVFVIVVGVAQVMHNGDVQRERREKAEEIRRTEIQTMCEKKYSFVEEPARKAYAVRDCVTVEGWKAAP